MTKKLNILRIKGVFDVKQKSFFINFKGLSAAKICFRPESAALNRMIIFPETHTLLQLRTKYLRQTLVFM